MTPPSIAPSPTCPARIMADGDAETVDLVVLGGGCAGLSLAARLARFGDDAPKTVIIEPRTAYENDRTWSFWSRNVQPSPFADLASARWDGWRFSKSGEHITHGPGAWRYHRLAAGDFYHAAEQAIAGNPRIALRLGVRARTVKITRDNVEIRTDQSTVRARHVVDTRPPDRSQTSILVQSFIGADVQAGAPIFDPTIAGVMEDLRTDAHGFAFNYVLPQSPTEALVEVTRFSPAHPGWDVLDADLDQVLADLPGAPVRLRTERGALPMGLSPHPPTPSPRIARAGTAAGALRASSSYGFQRIQRWADHCAEALAQGGPPMGHPPEPRLRAAMDQIFLTVLQREPGRAPDLFFALAKALDADAFARFMEDQATASDLWRVITALPPTPFLKAAWRRLGPKDRAKTGHHAAAHKAPLR